MGARGARDGLDSARPLRGPPAGAGFAFRCDGLSVPDPRRRRPGHHRVVGVGPPTNRGAPDVPTPRHVWCRPDHEGVGMRPPEETTCCTLTPFDRREAISIGQAAEVAGKSVGTLYNWCRQHGLGRRVGGGTWFVSKVALAMFLDGDMIALAAYQAGERSGDLVGQYFERFKLQSVSKSLQNSQSSHDPQLVRRAASTDA
ncbi:hypothetical protein ACVWZ3_008084 [Bradyrhizobium sp. i1.3.6]